MGRHTRALQLAQTRLEMACSAGFARAASDSGTADGFTWQALVDSSDIGLRRVRVTVRWTDKGRARSVELGDLMAQR